MFRNLVFLQGDDATPYLDIFAMHGARCLIDTMCAEGSLNFDGEVTEEIGHGTDDALTQFERFHVINNHRLGYIGISYWHFKDEVSNEHVA